MWCASCKADVAAEASPQTGRVQCAICGLELAQARAIRERTKDAREILERWSAKSLLDPYGPLPGSRGAQATDNHSPSDTTAGPEPAPAAETPQTRRFRIDGAQSVGDVAGTQSTRRRSQRKPVRRHLDQTHARELPGPHFPLTPTPRSNWSVAAGQWLAYIGVLALTVGTAIVVYGHFGGYSNYTPTGWLITTLGQMLLFLGVINLVSGGMEQSNDEVSQRIEVLGEQLLRIEARTDQALKGPHIPAERYAHGSQTTRESEHVRVEQL